MTALRTKAHAQLDLYCTSHHKSGIMGLKGGGYE